MSLTARTIGGPIAGTSVTITDDCSNFSVIKRTMSLCHHAVRHEVTGTYKRIPGVTPPRFLWQGWNT